MVPEDGRVPKIRPPQHPSLATRAGVKWRQSPQCPFLNWRNTPQSGQGCHAAMEEWPGMAGHRGQRAEARPMQGLIREGEPSRTSMEYP